MTYHCQICARDIKIVRGIIAHHGYTRPGYGWQTASCMGAKYLPYEQSRDRIPYVLDAYKNTCALWEAKLKDFIENPPAELIERYISPFTGKHDKSRDETYTRPEGFTAAVSLAIEKPSWYTQKYERQFNIMVRDMERNIRDIKHTRDWLQKRYDSWTMA